MITPRQAARLKDLGWDKPMASTTTEVELVT